METTLTHSYAQDLLATAENQMSGVADPEQWLIDTLGGSRAASGVRVNTQSVLGLPAAWRSVDLISSKLGSMPAEVQRREPGEDNTYRRMPGHPVERLLNRMCGALYTPFTLRQTMTLHALLNGNGRAFIERNGMGQALSLTLMLPQQSYTVVIDGEKFHCVYFTRDQFGDVLTPELEAALNRARVEPINTSGGYSYYTIPDSSVLHIPGLSYNGLWGIPIVNVARDAFGVDQSGLDAISYQFRNGGRPGLLLTAPVGLFPTEKQAREFMSQFKAKHEGTANAGRIGMLREGMTAQEIDAPDAFSGLTDLKDSSKSDIALLFGTEYLLGEISAVYKDLQSRMTAFYQNTLDKWAETWEQECGRKLLNRQSYESGLVRLHLDPTQILRGTPNELAEYTGSLRTQGLISGNEGRRYHNLPPADGLDDDFGNPFIATPDTEPAEPETTEPEPEEPAEEQPTNSGDRGYRAIVRHFERMREFESRRVVECCKSESGFFDRIDEFYEGFESNLTELCIDLTIDAGLAAAHCEESKRLIRDLAGVVVGAEQLQLEIKSLLCQWGARYAQFTDI